MDPEDPASEWSTEKTKTTKKKEWKEMGPSSTFFYFLIK